MFSKFKHSNFHIIFSTGFFSIPWQLTINHWEKFYIKKISLLYMKNANFHKLFANNLSNLWFKKFSDWHFSVDASLENKFEFLCRLKILFENLTSIIHAMIFRLHKISLALSLQSLLIISYLIFCYCGSLASWV